MLQWIADNSDTINTISNVAMLLVWVAYLQVFLQGYRRQVRPKIVINRAAGSGLDASCFVSNMSSESIYLEIVIVTLRCGEFNASHTVTDVDSLDGEERPNDPRKRTLQGPLRPGDYTSIGSFDSLIATVLRRKGEAVDRLKNSEDPIHVEVMVAADYSSDDLLVGARRAFAADWEARGWHLTPRSAETEQIRSRRERHKIKQAIAGQG
ncbi:hypothetical protein [Pelagibacterium montanilacus]|uniref:hypothetical protein n=1 Tax=Pelagibacterium montanilacus TaxID=2185280 RepID=UPI000F8D5DB7|nr:hypothetical protein [Pelagibacterium montanilacus]